MVSIIEDNRGDVIIPREDMISHAEYMDMYLAVGVAIEIHNVLGRGMSEKVYQEAYLIEAMKRNFEVERERPLHLIYKDVTLTQTFIPDFYYRGLVMEFKSVEEILPVHRAQLLNYLRFARLRRGILFNFGETNLHTERYLYLPSEDRFIMLNKDNIHQYVSD